LHQTNNEKKRENQKDQNFNMFKKIGTPLLVALLFCLHSTAQTTTIPIHFKLKFNSNDVVKGQNFISKNNDTLSIETFKCYLSNFKLEYTDKSISEIKNHYYLLDSDSLKSFRIELPKKENKTISKITFAIGIDSITNTLGIQNGALDPINGMYWAWQSGYINFKIEGKSSSCKTRLNKFHFHIGGYLYPNYALRIIEIPIHKSQNPTKTLDLTIDLATFFNEIHLEENNSIMIPGKKAMELADLSVKLFSEK